MRIALTLALASLLAGPAAAAELNVAIEVPALKVAEYHRPYVAVWIERADQSVAANLAVWYQQKAAKPMPGEPAQTAKKEEGTKWLADLRQWWRRSGRNTTMPIDGVSGATRPAGVHKLAFNDRQGPLAGLAPGNYNLVVEAVREVGGHELVRIALQWPPAKPVHSDAKGEHELGVIALDLAP